MIAGITNPAIITSHCKLFFIFIFEFALTSENLQISIFYAGPDFEQPTKIELGFGTKTG